MHSKMDAHVSREDNRPNPRRTNDPRSKTGKYDKMQHVPVTKGVRTKRAETVVYPYGGKPYETITRPFQAKKHERKRTVAHQRDQIGKQVARESSAARKGCTLVIVRADEAKAFAYKLKAAIKGGQIRDRFDPRTDSALYETRSNRVLSEITRAADNGTSVTLGVYTRHELQIIGAQRINAKHYTRPVRNLERKLAGNR